MLGPDAEARPARLSLKLRRYGRRFKLSLKSPIQHLSLRRRKPAASGSACGRRVQSRSRTSGVAGTSRRFKLSLGPNVRPQSPQAQAPTQPQAESHRFSLQLYAYRNRRFKFEPRPHDSVSACRTSVVAGAAADSGVSRGRTVQAQPARRRNRHSIRATASTEQFSLNRRRRKPPIQAQPRPPSSGAACAATAAPASARPPIQPQSPQRSRRFKLSLRRPGRSFSSGAAAGSRRNLLRLGPKFRRPLSRGLNPSSLSRNFGRRLQRNLPSRRLQSPAPRPTAHSRRFNKQRPADGDAATRWTRLRRRTTSPKKYLLLLIVAAALAISVVAWLDFRSRIRRLLLQPPIAALPHQLLSPSRRPDAWQLRNQAEQPSPPPAERRTPWFMKSRQTVPKNIQNKIQGRIYVTSTSARRPCRRRHRRTHGKTRAEQIFRSPRGQCRSRMEVCSDRRGRRSGVAVELQVYSRRRHRTRNRAIEHTWPEASTSDESFGGRSGRVGAATLEPWLPPEWTADSMTSRTRNPGQSAGAALLTAVDLQRRCLLDSGRHNDLSRPRRTCRPQRAHRHLRRQDSVRNESPGCKQVIDNPSLRVQWRHHRRWLSEQSCALHRRSIRSHTTQRRN